jgi:hypothetical protein
MHVGLFLFLAGYLSAGLATVAAVIASFHWTYVPAVMCFEFAVFKLIAIRRGQAFLSIAPVRAQLFTWFVHSTIFLMMCFAPMTQSRVDWELGGYVYGSIIVYKSVSFAVVFYFATEKFADLDEVGMDAAVARRIFGVAWGCAVLGAGMFLGNIRSCHRWTFYKSRQTGPDHFQWLFDGDQLISVADAQDEQRVHTWLSIHPSYMNKVKVKAWLLGLKLNDELFKDKEKKLPKGCGSKAGHSFSSLFRKSLERYAFFGDEEGLAEIKTHLESLEAEIDAREVKKNGEKEEDMREIEEETEVGRLERLLEEEKKGRQKEKTLRERAEEEVATRDAIIEEKDAIIAEMKKTQ